MDDKKKDDIFSVGELGDRWKVQSWRISRLFQLGLVEEPPRLAGRRAITANMLPAIKAALLAKGWMKPSSEEDQQ